MIAISHPSSATSHTYVFESRFPPTCQVVEREEGAHGVQGVERQQDISHASSATSHLIYFIPGSHPPAR